MARLAGRRKNFVFQQPAKSDVSFDRQIRQKDLNFSGSNIFGLAYVMKHNIAPSPIDVRLFRPQALMPCPNRDAKLVQQFQRRSVHPQNLGLPNAFGKMSSFYLWAVLTTVEDWQTLAVLGDVAQL
jgi:hypothetical protein